MIRSVLKPRNQANPNRGSTSMKPKLISLSCVRIAMLAGLVKSVAPVKLQDRRGRWGILVLGRGFQRLLAKSALQGEFIPATSQHYAAQPVALTTWASAARYATSLALMSVGSQPKQGAP